MGVKLRRFIVVLRAGRHVVNWDGLSSEGDLLRPGIYMIAIDLLSDNGRYEIKAHRLGLLKKDKICFLYRSLLP